MINLQIGQIAERERERVTRCGVHAVHGRLAGLQWLVQPAWPHTKPAASSSVSCVQSVPFGPRVSGTVPADRSSLCQRERAKRENQHAS